MKRVHILYISAFSQWGGSTISLLRRIEKLDAGNFRVTVVVPEDGPMIEKYQAANAQVEIVSMSILLRFNSLWSILAYVLNFFPSVLRLYRLIKERDVDLAHSNDSIILVAGVAAKFAGVKSITHIRDDIRNPVIVVRFRNILINLFSDHIFIVSRATLDNFVDLGGNKAKSEVLYDGVDIEVFKPGINGNDVKKAFSIPEEAQIVTHIARIDPNKGQECLVYAAISIIKSVSSAYFLLVGDINNSKFQWYKERLLQIITKNGLKERVIITGRQDSILDILRITDVVALPSAYEALPGVICEASACGKPVVASNVGGVPEMVRDGETGYLVPPQDIESLSKSLIHILSDSACAERMGLSGRGYMEEKFDLNRLTCKLEMIYEYLLN